MSRTETFKKISRQTEQLLVEWLATLVSEEEMKQVTTKNIMKFMPDRDIHTALSYGVRCVPFTPRWIRKELKKMYKHNPDIDIESVTLQDLEFAAMEQQQDASNRHVF